MLSYVSYNLNSIMNNINNYANKRIKIDKESIAFEAHKEKILMYIDRIKRLVKEFDDSLEYLNKDIYSKIVDQENAIRECTSNALLLNCISLISSTMDNSYYLKVDDYEYPYGGAYNKYMGTSRKDIAGIQPYKINAISNNIKLNNSRNIKYLNPCIFIRDEDTYIKDAFNNIDIYGIAEEEFTKMNDDSSEFNQNIYTKLIQEDDESLNDDSIKKNMRISNSVFDIVNVQPKISMTHKMKGDLYALPSKEITALRDNYRYLRPNGVMVYTIPFSRFSYEIMLFWAKNFNDITIFKPESDSETCNITIMGRKLTNINYEEIYAELKEIKYSDIETEPACTYYLPEDTKEIELFRGGTIRASDMAKIVSEAGLYDDFFKQINTHKILTDTQPLLPFNIGQVGLILTSGKLDGIVEEPGDRCHIIKGRTIKYIEHLQGSMTNDEDRVDKISNRVQINAFGADGLFKEIS